MPPSLKYAHVEREQRFLLAELPPQITSASPMAIYDRYLIGTQLRLRSVEGPGGEPVLKLGQKLRMEGPGPKKVAHTTMYLERDEYETLALLPAAELHKTRWIVIVTGTRVAIDEFHGELEGLVLAEVDLGQHGTQLALPSIPAVAEVSEDERFTGGVLATTGANVLAGLLQEFML